MKTPEQIAHETVKRYPMANLPGRGYKRYTDAIIAAIEADRAQRDMAEYRVGDPDPTPEDLVPSCGAEHEDGWLCTRRPGHPGPHIERTGERIAGVW